MHFVQFAGMSEGQVKAGYVTFRQYATESFEARRHNLSQNMKNAKFNLTLLLPAHDSMDGWADAWTSHIYSVSSEQAEQIVNIMKASGKLEAGRNKLLDLID